MSCHVTSRHVSHRNEFDIHKTALSCTTAGQDSSQGQGQGMNGMVWPEKRQRNGTSMNHDRRPPLPVVSLPVSAVPLLLLPLLLLLLLLLQLLLMLMLLLMLICCCCCCRSMLPDSTVQYSTANERTACFFFCYCFYCCCF